MNNNITPDMLIQYLDNELDARERLEVETHLSADAAARELLERLRLSKQAIRQYALKEQVAAIHREEMKERTAVQKTPVRRIHWLRRTMQIAALLLVLVLIAGLVQYSLLDANRLYRSQYSAFTLGTTRSNETISPIEQAYGRQNMTEVIALYRNGTSFQATDHFFAGQAFLATDNPAEAVGAFEKQLAANANQQMKPYQDDTEYYLGLAYLKTGDTDRALQLFEKIHRETSHTYHREISGWYLTKLRWLQRKKG